MLDNFSGNEFSSTLISLASAYIPQVILAIVTLIVGLWVIKWVVRLFTNAMKSKDIEPSLVSFSASTITIMLKLILIISVAGMVGVETTSVIAVLGAASLAIGLAFQNTLSNFAGSVLILVFRPYKTGDLVELEGRLGVVKEIQMFCTIITTPDNKTVIMPNGPLANGTIINLSREVIKRIDLTFGIGYGDDIGKAKDVLWQVIKSDPRVLKDPEATVAVSSLGDSSVNFAFRVWVKTEEYWDVYFDMQEKVKLELDKSKISIPFPQRDVHVFQVGE